MARTLVESGRHQLTVYCGSQAGYEVLQRGGMQPAREGDMEEVLADPAVDAVIVAGSPALRPGQLRRALQSERHVLCVHPAEDSVNIGYEAGMLQTDVKRALLPLLAEALHPGIALLAQLNQSQTVGMGPAPSTEASTEITALAPSAIAPGERSSDRRDDEFDVAVKDHASEVALSGRPVLLEIERWSTEEIVVANDESSAPCLPGWDCLRAIGGEIAEVYAQAAGEELEGRGPILLTGQFLTGLLFQSTLLPFQAENRLRISLVTPQGRAELYFESGWPGPARLSFIDDTGATQQRSWPALNPWEAVVEQFEQAVRTRSWDTQPTLTKSVARLGWQDEIRALELDDSARRSVHRRRASTLDYIEEAEEASFKGSMTLVGCSLLWICLLLLIFSVWFPWLGWAIVPMLVLFLVAHFVLYFLKAPQKSNDER